MENKRYFILTKLLMCAIIIARLKTEVVLFMSMKRITKRRMLGRVFAVFFVFVSMTTGLWNATINNNDVFAEPTPPSTIEEDEGTRDDDATPSNDGSVDTDQPDDNTGTSTTDNNEDGKLSKGDACKISLGALGWVVCPVMNKISEAVDWLYGKIEDILIINPITTQDGSPIYEIWKYCLGVTNVVFIIFFLVVIYSQITGWGITNYGVKKALPKLIVMAIMVNISFLLCSILVDLSNIAGNGLRGLFESVETAAAQSAGIKAGSTSAITMAKVYTSIAGGTALTIGAGAIAFDFGLIWMLIPTALGAIVAVVTGLITIALRQAVVVLLVMISPLAFVSSILPNTEDLFKKWKKLLTQMLVFYPVFS